MAALDGGHNIRRGDGSGGGGRGGIRYFAENFDDPPYSRLFLQMLTPIMKPELWERFAAFGEIQDIWAIRSQASPDLVSFAFIKFARSSEACRAAETVQDQTSPAPIKVSLAQSRTSKQIEFQQLTRICVNVPESFTEEKLRDIFKVYGDIVSCVIQRKAVLNGDKDLAYIKFSKASQAAFTLEECGNCFNAVWADVPNTLTKPSGHTSGVNGPKQKTTTHEVQESSVIATGSRTTLTQPMMQPSGARVHASCVSSTNQETQSHGVQGSALITLVSRTKKSKRAEFCVDKPYVRSANQKMNSHGVQERNLITLGTTPSQSCEQEYYVGSSGYRMPLTQPVMKPPESSVLNSFVDSGKQEINSHRAQGSSLITFGFTTENWKPAEPVSKPSESCEQEYYVGGSNYRSALTQPVMKPLESSVHNSFVGSGKQETHRVQGSNLITLGCNTSWAEPASEPPESHGQEYYMGNAGYRPTLTEPVSKQHESRLHKSYVDSPEQETHSHGVQGSNLSNLTSDKFQEPSEHGVYTCGTYKETNSHEEQRSDFLESGSPGFASLEKRDTRSQESVSRRLSVVSEFPFLQEQLFNLFDLVPGLESCETRRGPYNNRAYAVIQYSSAASAIYAKDRLHGFEYPFGNRLLISFIEDGTDGTDHIRKMAAQLVTSQLSSTIWNNNWADQWLGSSSSNPPPRLQTDAELPSSKRKAPPDSSVRERLLIMFNPHLLSEDILDDVLSRFGNFINTYLIPGENLGYATFADRASASDAIAVLHGKTVNGVKLKVMLADLPTENSDKRQRIF
ncbi:RNA-binding protein 45-like [Elgaria multicarinata webbii]|uniref:RNA-binding protein 45-like n=1 Tax=Elgaria multicarinata webbii TaxID=159646 RepID=UPI002FCCC846